MGGSPSRRPNVPVERNRQRPQSDRRPQTDEKQEEEDIPVQIRFRPANVVDWDEKVIGQAEAKKALEYQFFLPRRFPTFFANTSTKSAILLWGPPGTGKTLLAESVAAAHGAELVRWHPGDVLSKYVGESEQIIKRIFEDGLKRKTIIFIDEIDAFGRSRKDGELEHERSRKNSLLQSLDNFLSRNSAVDSAVIACTNTPNELDKALLRRFDLHVFCELPALHERAQLLEFYARKSEIAGNLRKRDYTKIAEYTRHYSGSDIKRLVKRAASRPAYEVLEATHFMEDENHKWKPCDPDVGGAVEIALRDLEDDSLAPKRLINESDFRYAVQKSKPTLTREQYQWYLDQRPQNDEEATIDIQRTQFDEEFDHIFLPKSLDEMRLHSSLLMFRQFQRYMTAVSDQNSKCREAVKNQLTLLASISLAIYLICPTALGVLFCMISLMEVTNNVLLPLLHMVFQQKAFLTGLEGAFKEGSDLNQIGMTIFLVVTVQRTTFVTYFQFSALNVLIEWYLFYSALTLASYLYNFMIMWNRFNSNQDARFNERVAQLQKEDVNGRPMIQE